MDSALKREIDAAEGNLPELFRQLHGEDPGAREYALHKIIDSYIEQRKRGALLALCASLSEEQSEMAGLALVDSIPTREGRVPGRGPRKFGILDDLAFDRRKPETVRVAAGMKKVDRLFERLKNGDESARKEIEGVRLHRRAHWYVKVYAGNSLDALEIAKRKPKNISKGRKGMNNPKPQGIAVGSGQEVRMGSRR